MTVQLSNHAAQSLKILQPPVDFNAEVDAAVLRLNHLWQIHATEIEDINPDRRHRALELEAEMTKAANGGDLTAARSALKEWANLFTPERSLL